MPHPCSRPSPWPQEPPRFPSSHLHAVGLPSPSLAVGENADAVALEAGQHRGLQLPEDLEVWGGGGPELWSLGQGVNRLHFPGRMALGELAGRQRRLPGEDGICKNLPGKGKGLTGGEIRQCRVLEPDHNLRGLGSKSRVQTAMFNPLGVIGGVPL